jgi:hypothetical protein
MSPNFLPAQKAFLQACATIFIDRCTISVIETCEALRLTGTNQDALRGALADYPMVNFVGKGSALYVGESRGYRIGAREDCGTEASRFSRLFVHYHLGFVRSEDRDAFRE